MLHVIEVLISPRPGVFDPASRAIHDALNRLGHAELTHVSLRRIIRLEIEGDTPAHALDRAEQMCHQLLVEPALEDYTLRLASDAAERSP